MSDSSPLLGRWFLRYGAVLAPLRRVPVLGKVLRWTGQRFLPKDTLVWAQISAGAAKGLWIELRPRLGQAVLRGANEVAVQEAMLEHLRPGMTFYDVGANIGLLSLLGARLVGPNGRVVCFEADPELVERLRRNLARNAFEHATVVAKAVWSHPTTVSFARVDPSVSPDRGLGHVTQSADAAGTISVEAVSLDAFVASDRGPDFIKCDVEGAEDAVFEGAERLLRDRRPILLVELHSPELHQTLTRKFTALGYRCRDLDANHVLALPR